MIAFDISVDGQRLCTAGVGEPGVVSLIASGFAAARVMKHNQHLKREYGDT